MKIFLRIVGGISILGIIYGIGSAITLGRYIEGMFFQGVGCAGICLFLAIMFFKAASHIEELERTISSLYDSIHEMKSGSNRKPAITSYMKCPKCGGFSPKGSHHCDNCGADLYNSMY